MSKMLRLIFIGCALMCFTGAGYAQIFMQGLVEQHEGIYTWNADGTGPEPAAAGHITGSGAWYYYYASADYNGINPAPGAAMAHLTNTRGFPQFNEKLLQYNYTLADVQVKCSLSDLGDDIEGLDWFDFASNSFSNYYHTHLIILVDGHGILSLSLDYNMLIVNHFSGTMVSESGYAPVRDISGAAPPDCREIAQAFLADMGKDELKFIGTSIDFHSGFGGNGRTGSKYSISGYFERGRPEMPLVGLASDHEGLAGWNADGSGPEPAGVGHNNFFYYTASRDYGGIDPHGSAAFAHFTDGYTGFRNTQLQLMRCGYQTSDLKIKTGLSSLGPDIPGNDWGYSGSHHWSNFYNNYLFIELSGEPILIMLADTNQIMEYTNDWTCKSSFSPVYNISASASDPARLVALSILKDVGSHYLLLKTSSLIRLPGSEFSTNGRSGEMWEVISASLAGEHNKATFISANPVSGVWTADHSPYFIDDHVMVENGSVLTIEPGVEIKVRAQFLFDVQGSIVAGGDAIQPVLFTRSNPLFYWGGVRFVSTPQTNDSSKFDHCIFEHAQAQGEYPYNCGGAMRMSDYSKISITNTTFRNNFANFNHTGYVPVGGAIAMDNSKPFIQNCRFLDNFAGEGGAITVSTDSKPVVSNCLFARNQAAAGGAISFRMNGDGLFTNCTFADNVADRGGALHCTFGSNPFIINSILWNNSANIGKEVYLGTAGAHPGFYYCDIQLGSAGFGGFGGTHFNGDYLFNLERDPQFAGEGEFPYALGNGSSPCWNAGTPDTSAWFYRQYLPDVCLCGNIRIGDNRIDIGAYEYMLTTGSETPLSRVNDGLLIYPNPSSEEIRIDLDMQNTGKVVIELFDLSGRMVALPVEQNCSRGLQKLIYNPGQLARGVYSCRITAEGRTINRLLVRN